MTNVEFHQQIAARISEEYDCFEENVDPPDRACSTYQSIRQRVVREFRDRHPRQRFDDKVLRQRYFV